MILVVGATGSVGGRVTRGLSQQGQAVRFLARNNPISEELAKQGRANTAQSLIEAGAQAVPGDLKDRASLDEAVKGVDTVITTASSWYSRSARRRCGSREYPWYAPDSVQTMAATVSAS